MVMQGTWVALGLVTMMCAAIPVHGDVDRWEPPDGRFPILGWVIPSPEGLQAYADAGFTVLRSPLAEDLDAAEAADPNSIVSRIWEHKTEEEAERFIRETIDRPGVLGYALSLKEGVWPISAIKVLVAEDETDVRYALAQLLGADDDIDVVGEAPDGELAVALARQNRPDVVLMDLDMPKTDGIEATRAIKEQLPDCAICVLTLFDDDEHILQALKAGADG